MTAVQRRAAILCAAAAIGTVFAPSSSAVAASSKRVQMADGVISANGAAVTMVTTFTCPAGYQAFLSTQIIEAIGKNFAGGFDSQTRDCTGEKQKIKFFVQAVPAGDNTRPFVAGPASARVILDAVDPAAIDGYDAEPPASDEPAPLLPGLPPVESNQTRADDPMPAEAPPSIHAEDSGTITLKAKS